MIYGHNDGIIIIRQVCNKSEPVFMHELITAGKGVGHIHGNAVLFEFADEVGHAGIADVAHIFLEGGAHYQDFCTQYVFPGFDELLHALFGHIKAHAVIDIPAGVDHPGMVTVFFGFVGQVIGIHTDAMSSDQTRVEFQKIPFGARSFDHIVNIDVHATEDDREFVHKGDVDVALGVLDDFSSFSDFDGRRPVNTWLHDEFIDFCDLIQ